MAKVTLVFAVLMIALGLAGYLLTSLTVEVTAKDLREFLAEHLARWQVPEWWTFIPEVPKTSTGKFDKKILRASYAEGALEVEEVR